MRILVTGGAGFIGSHVVQALLERGDEVVVVDSLESQVHDGVPTMLPPDVTFVEAGVADVGQYERAISGIDQVVHLAAAVGVGQSMYEIARYVNVNTLATAHFLEWLINRSPRPARLVVASSMSIYGEGEYECAEHGAVAPPPRSEEQLAGRLWECFCPHCSAELRPIPTRETKQIIPTSIYAITKRDHEELCLVTGAAYGIPTVALRFFNVYGPGQALSNPYTGVAAIFSSRLLNDKAPLVFEDGRQSRDFIHVRDIVAAILLALDSDAAVGHAINVGTGRPTTVDEMAALLARGLGKELAPAHVEKYRAGDIRHCFADPTRGEELLGFQASVRLEDGIGDLLEWVKPQIAADRVDEATRELAARGLSR
jgi:dTDP-L-rhamnose 4-epimerase